MSPQIKESGAPPTIPLQRQPGRTGLCTTAPKRSPVFLGEAIFLYLPGYGGGSEATGAFFFLNTYGSFLRWRIWATYLFFQFNMHLLMLSVFVHFCVKCNLICSLRGHCLHGHHGSSGIRIVVCGYGLLFSVSSATFLRQFHFLSWTCRHRPAPSITTWKAPS